MVVYFYDGSLEGFFSAIFDAYTCKDKPDIITVSENFQSMIDQVSHYVETEQHKYERVYAGIIDHIGRGGYQTVKTVFLSPSPQRETILYHYLEYGFKVGSKVHVDIAHELVNPVMRLKRETGMEAHRIRMFARFSRMDNGVYFAKINPKCNVLPLVMDHFSRRFNIQPFAIYDEVHHLLGLYDMKGWHLRYVEDDFEPPDCDVDDVHYQKLWKAFYDAVSIEERVNHPLRRNFMPMRFWSNLTEMTYIDAADTIGADADISERSKSGSESTPLPGQAYTRALPLEV
ncbi:MAG: TIGR03915 family putative DNA repair protein [Actinomycetia bacterium]|nr:TIGR03915 family putative DNA repair protein [Actinomycetes bacterium]